MSDLRCEPCRQFGKIILTRDNDHCIHSFRDAEISALQATMADKEEGLRLVKDHNQRLESERDALKAELEASRKSHLMFVQDTLIFEKKLKAELAAKEQQLMRSIKETADAVLIIADAQREVAINDFTAHHVLRNVRQELSETQAKLGEAENLAEQRLDLYHYAAKRRTEESFAKDKVESNLAAQEKVIEKAKEICQEIDETTITIETFDKIKAFLADGGGI